VLLNKEADRYSSIIAICFIIGLQHFNKNIIFLQYLYVIKFSSIEMEMRWKQFCI